MRTHLVEERLVGVPDQVHPPAAALQPRAALPLAPQPLPRQLAPQHHAGGRVAQQAVFFCNVMEGPRQRKPQALQEPGLIRVAQHLRRKRDIRLLVLYNSMFTSHLGAPAHVWGRTALTHLHCKLLVEISKEHAANMLLGEVLHGSAHSNVT